MSETLGDILQAALDKEAAERVRVEQERKARALVERHDDVLRELERCDKFWWTIYPEAAQIHRELLTDPLDTSIPRALKIKREIVAKHIIPAMYACIRAGFVVPVQRRVDDPWEPK